MDRRKFLKASFAGLIGLTQIDKAMAQLGSFGNEEYTVDKVALGNSGLTVPRIAMGTGSIGGNGASNQTRLGTEGFVKLAHHAYERGISFFDMADSYGSQPFVGAALKALPREKVTLLTKMSTLPDGSEGIEPVSKTLDRFRLEIGTDYIDILLMHFMYRPGWENNRTHYMEGLSRAKEEGIVKAVGVSCHNAEALSVAADHPWVDVIMARINPFGTNMDADPDTIKEILGRAKRNGKGVVGMKIFGEGKHVQDDERETSYKFAMTEGNVHCMTLGLESIAQTDDAVDRVMRIVKGL